MNSKNTREFGKPMDSWQFRDAYFDLKCTQTAWRSRWGAAPQKDAFVSACDCDNFGIFGRMTVAKQNLGAEHTHKPCRYTFILHFVFPKQYMKAAYVSGHMVPGLWFFMSTVGRHPNVLWKIDPQMQWLQRCMSVCINTTIVLNIWCRLKLEMQQH